MSSSTSLSFPPTLPYPIKITRICASRGEAIKPGSKLLEYSFTQVQKAAPEDEEPEKLLLFGSWDTSLEGTVEDWVVRVGQTITSEEAKAMAGRHGAVVVKEKCSHDVQIGGMCAVCGEDMTRFEFVIVCKQYTTDSDSGSRMDYTGFTPSSIATLPATHLADGPTVSLSEAKRLDEEQKKYV